jgi:putative hydrolase of the HAD superfamily
MKLFPEALACLTAWRASGVRLGLVTNGDASQQRDKITRHALAAFFDVIVIEGEFGAGKPDEVVYRHALDTLGARAEDTCMVGDHLDFDVAGAQRLGMRGIWIDRVGTGLPPGCAVRPDAIIRALTELEEALRRPVAS